MAEVAVKGVDLASPHQKPDRWQHPTRCQTNPKTACAPGGVHRWEADASLFTFLRVNGGGGGVLRAIARQPRPNRQGRSEKQVDEKVGVKASRFAVSPDFFHHA